MAREALMGQAPLHRLTVSEDPLPTSSSLELGSVSLLLPCFSREWGFGGQGAGGAQAGRVGAPSRGDMAFFQAHLEEDSWRLPLLISEDRHRDPRDSTESRSQPSHLCQVIFDKDVKTIHRERTVSSMTVQGEWDAHRRRWSWTLP